jgi:hypothetical protein
VLGAAASLVAIGAVAVAVLRDIAAFDRPASVPVERPVERPAAPVPDVPRAAVPRAAAPRAEVPRADERSILGTLATTEADERPPLRRVGSGLLLLAVTLVTAGLVGALIYRGLAGLR